MTRKVNKLKDKNRLGEIKHHKIEWIGELVELHINVVQFLLLFIKSDPYTVYKVEIGIKHF